VVVGAAAMLIGLWIERRRLAAQKAVP